MGRDYQSLQDALERIRDTIIRTNIKTGDEEQTNIFGLIDSASVRRKHGLDGRLLWCEIELSEWIFNAIKAREVLTLHRDYFRLRKPIERRIYEIARKYCGRQDSWKIGLPLLLKKCGSQSSEKKFRHIIRHLTKHDYLPDYHINFNNETDVVMFVNRGTMPEKSLMQQSVPSDLNADTMQEARIVAPGWDVYYLEQEWRNWMVDGGFDAPRNPDKAFLGFCRKWFEKRGRP
ncbi:hypothetical protein X471_00719 [Bartonella bacilliformis str. Heidi Mejia]|uniref:replication initiator protein A n=1 Tax=Bartonella bacilliformis TaxID=774 RepID=UPI00044602CE|nr:hypothetical protein X471_00719 [Bartonella bacilliformis str. Heidi Mejia]EYS95757.1 hypothetical protein X470_00349 [Bartonella bacilliformis Peru-18]KEG17923.1 hypothetical protein H709_00241 [Bartonella bacilliformis CUSCO5]KEG18512.1 hypothetical protein H707_00231 [Bartonella bacilliformis Hosp800-02]KEG23620.1 hypothetical protein H708_00238 [Bartonella bacilliformis VAB9028]KEG24828.1 hypothetical protein H706_00240 [Bartonella bacilliformis CAR600-02]